MLPISTATPPPVATRRPRAGRSWKPRPPTRRATMSAQSTYGRAPSSACPTPHQKGRRMSRKPNFTDLRSTGPPVAAPSAVMAALMAAAAPGAAPAPPAGRAQADRRLLHLQRVFHHAHPDPSSRQPEVADSKGVQGHAEKARQSLIGNEGAIVTLKVQQSASAAAEYS